jgi:hypothetical protein
MALDSGAQMASSRSRTALRGGRAIARFIGFPQASRSRPRHRSRHTTGRRHRISRAQSSSRKCTLKIARRHQRHSAGTMWQPATSRWWAPASRAPRRRPRGQRRERQRPAWTFSLSSRLAPKSSTPSILPPFLRQLQRSLAGLHEEDPDQDCATLCLPSRCRHNNASSAPRSALAEAQLLFRLAERERVNEDTRRRESLVLWIDDDDAFLAHREMRGAVILVRPRRDIVEWDRQGLAGIHEQGA